METEKLQCIAIFISGMLISLTKSQDYSNCWLGAPSVNEATITHDISAVQLTDSSQSWDIRATLTWDRPAGFNPNTDSYVVSIREVESNALPEDGLVCVISGNERTVDFEAVTFANLSFGFLFEFKLYMYDTSTSKKSLTPTTAAFLTPDCYQATSDPAFCSTIDVQYSGAPLDPLLETICFNDTSESVEVTVSWLPPIQVNGILEFFDLLVTSASDNFDRGDTPEFDAVSPSSEPPGDFSESFGPLAGGRQKIVSVPLSYTEGDRITTSITSLDRDEYYFLTITPIVSTEGESVKMHPGIEVEMSFFTDVLNETDAIPTCGGEYSADTTIQPSTKQPADFYVTTRTPTIPILTKTPDSSIQGHTTKTKTNSGKPAKTKEDKKTPPIRRTNLGSGDSWGVSEPITPVGIVIVVLATLVVTVLVITTLIVGVHYMRGVAPESPTKLGPLSAGGSRRSNGVAPEGNGAPLTEDV